ncbi:MAG: hypothetical protein JO000_24160 [Alphaproteobacteria bacterium]|nr:hypothetical protein [Alphaproteobacteria bacterium]
MRAPSTLGTGALLLAAIDAFAPQAAAQTRPTPALNTIKDVGHALGACWVPPPVEKSRPGTQITFWITFTRSGEVMGEPKITYITPGLPQEIRSAYQMSVADAISRCSPLPFTPALGAAVAGRPFAMRYDDTRGQKGA